MRVAWWSQFSLLVLYTRYHVKTMSKAAPKASSLRHQSSLLFSLLSALLGGQYRYDNCRSTGTLKLNFCIS